MKPTIGQPPVVRR